MATISMRTRRWCRVRVRSKTVSTSSSATSNGHLHAWDFAARKITRTFDATVLFKTGRIQDIDGLRVLAFFDGGKLLLAAGATPEKGVTIQSTPTLLAFDFAPGDLRHKFT